MLGGVGLWGSGGTTGCRARVRVRVIVRVRVS